VKYGNKKIPVKGLGSSDMLMHVKLFRRKKNMPWLRNTVAGLTVSILIFVVSIVGLPMGSIATASDMQAGNIDYDSGFFFVRIRYDMSLRSAGRLFGGDLPWAHDYPRAEQNLARILESVTAVKPSDGPNGSNILDLDDPELYKFPFAYMSEPGYWTLSDQEAEGLRAYLLKGGFLVFDDFRGDHWFNFEKQLKRVLPDSRLIELDISHPVFHSFFDIDTLEMPWMYNLPPRFYGVYENNDPNGRLMLVANYNNDIGEYWEYSDTGWLPIDLSNEAYKFGVNYVMYAMTH